MCQEIQPYTKFLCGCVIDEPAFTEEWKGCGKCGEVKHTARLGSTTKRVPCDDCQASGAWVRDANGSWIAQ